MLGASFENGYSIISYYIRTIFDEYAKYNWFWNEGLSITTFFGMEIFVLFRRDERIMKIYVLIRRNMSHFVRQSIRGGKVGAFNQSDGAFKQSNR